MMIAAMAVPAAALAMPVDIPYQQTFTNDSAEKSVADTFNYQLKADGDSPAPDGATNGEYSFSLKGNTKGTLNLNIPFTKPGYYYYTVKSTDNPKKGYTYSSKDYTVMVMTVNGSSGLEIGAITIQDANLDKYDKLEFKTKYYKKKPNGDDDDDDDDDNDNPGGGAAGGPGDGAVAANAGNDGDDGNDGTDNGPTTTIDDPEPPLAGVEEPEEDYWALINLIATLINVIAAIGAIICYVRRRNELSDLLDQNEEAAKTGGELEETEDPEKLKRMGYLRFLAIIVAIIAIIVFIITEDMTLPMKLFDEWTILMIILLAITLLLILISRKKIHEDSEQEETG